MEQPVPPGSTPDKIKHLDGWKEEEKRKQEGTLNLVLTFILGDSSMMKTS